MPLRTRRAAPDCRQDLLADAGVRRPDRKLVEQPPVVDLEQRRYVSHLAAGRRHRIRMRPVGAPDDAVGIGLDQGFRERDAILIIGRQFGRAVGSRNLHIGLAGFYELDEIGEARLLHAERGLRAAEMVEHDRHRSAQHEILDRDDHWEAGVELDMPAARLHALDRGGEARAADIGIVDATGCEVKADAAEADLVHGVERALRRLVVDHGDAAGRGAAGHHAVLAGRIVGAVDARRHDHHALHVQRLVQRAHLFGRGGLRRVDAAGEERELLDIAVDVGVAVAGVLGDIKIDRRRRLNRLGQNIPVLHECPGGDGSEHHMASRQHWFSPWWVRRGACWMRA